MRNYVILLKGINVGGHHKIKMADLNNHLQNTGLFLNVKTYIQSGNIVLFSELSPSEVEQTIEECIQEHYGFYIATKAFSKELWLKVSETHPYLDQAEEIKMLHLTFLYLVPDKTKFDEVLSFKPDNEHCTMIGSTLYLYYPNGVGRCKFTSALIERKLKCHTTSRNWRTVQKLRSMLLES